MVTYSPRYRRKKHLGPAQPDLAGTRASTPRIHPSPSLSSRFAPLSKPNANKPFYITFLPSPEPVGTTFQQSHRLSQAPAPSRAVHP